MSLMQFTCEQYSMLTQEANRGKIVLLEDVYRPDGSIVNNRLTVLYLLGAIAYLIEAKVATIEVQGHGGKIYGEDQQFEYDPDQLRLICSIEGFFHRVGWITEKQLQTLHNLLTRPQDEHDYMTADMEW